LNEDNQSKLLQKHKDILINFHFYITLFSHC